MLHARVPAGLLSARLVVPPQPARQPLLRRACHAACRSARLPGSAAPPSAAPRKGNAAGSRRRSSSFFVPALRAAGPYLLRALRFALGRYLRCPGPQVALSGLVPRPPSRSRPLPPAGPTGSLPYRILSLPDEMLNRGRTLPDLSPGLDAPAAGYHPLHFAPPTHITHAGPHAGVDLKPDYPHQSENKIPN